MCRAVVHKPALSNQHLLAFLNLLPLSAQRYAGYCGKDKSSTLHTRLSGNETCIQTPKPWLLNASPHSTGSSYHGPYIYCAFDTLTPRKSISELRIGIMTERGSPILSEG